MEKCTVFDEDGNPEFVYAAQISAQFGLVGNSPIRCDLAAADGQSAFWLGQVNLPAAKSPELIIDSPGTLEVDNDNKTITFSSLDPQEVGDWVNGARSALTVMFWMAVPSALPIE